MKTEELNIEYGILYLLLKYGNEAVTKLKELNVYGEYFGNLFHRKFYDLAVDTYSANPKMTYKGYISYYRSLPSTTDKDKIALKSLIKEINDNKIGLSDLTLHCKQLKRYYVSRKYLKDVSRLLERNTVDIEDVLADVSSNITDYRLILDDDNSHNVMNLKSDFHKRLDYVKDIKNNPNKLGLIETGLQNLDKFIGKQHRGAYVIYEARTGVGKSMMLMGTAVHNFKRGRKVIVITIEMSASDYLFRTDSHLTKFNHSDFAMGDIIDDKEKLNKWEEIVRETGEDDNDLIVYWVPENCTPAKIHSIIANNPFKPDLVIVDYVGDMSANLKGIDNLDPKAQGHCSAKLKAMAGEFNCVIYTGQQTKRGVKKIDTESGANTDIANRKADILIGIMCTKEDEAFIYEHDGDIYYGRLSIFIAKGRNVPKCKTHIIPDFVRMSWLEKEMEDIQLTDGGVSKSNKKVNDEAMAKANKEIESDETIELDDDDDTPILLD